MMQRWVWLVMWSCLGLHADELTIHQGPGERKGRSAALFEWKPDSKATGSILLTAEIVGSDQYREKHKWQLVRIDPTETLFFRLELPAGDYTLKMKGVNRHKELLGRVEQPFQVTKNEAQHPALEATRLRIMLPEKAKADLISGRPSFKVAVQGQTPAKVRWLLNGKEMAVTHKAPFKARINLDKAPLVQRLRAVAYDEDNRILGSGQRLLNMGPYALMVDVTAPQARRKLDGPFTARAQVRIPRDRELERLEFYMDNRKRAVLYEEPFEMVFTPNPDGLPFDIMAKAYLRDGAVVDRRLQLNQDQSLPGLEIRNVDLWVTVTDKRGLPKSGYQADNFQIFEDGKPMVLREFDDTTQQPLNLHFLMDVSGSMREYLDGIFNGVRAIIHNELSNKDRMGIISFRDEPDLAVPFSNDRAELYEAMDKVRTASQDPGYHGSAIFDSLAASLHHFGGISGQRALVIFSDGLDNRSRFRKGEVVELARQAQVRLYVFDIVPDQASFALQSLAEETGGAYYKVAAPSRLPALFNLLSADLRMQYLFRYQSAREPGDTACRSIEVRCNEPKTKVRTMKGYCP